MWSFAEKGLIVITTQEWFLTFGLVLFGALLILYMVEMYIDSKRKNWIMQLDSNQARSWYSLERDWHKWKKVN